MSDQRGIWFIVLGDLPANQYVLFFYTANTVYIYIYILSLQNDISVYSMYSTFSEHKLPSLFTPVFSFSVKYQYIISSLFIPMCTFSVLQR